MNPSFTDRCSDALNAYSKLRDALAKVQEYEALNNVSDKFKTKLETTPPEKPSYILHSEFLNTKLNLTHEIYIAIKDFANTAFREGDFWPEALTFYQSIIDGIYAASEEVDGMPPRMPEAATINKGVCLPMEFWFYKLLTNGDSEAVELKLNKSYDIDPKYLASLILSIKTNESIYSFFTQTSDELQRSLFINGFDINYPDQDHCVIYLDAPFSRYLPDLAEQLEIYENISSYFEVLRSIFHAVAGELQDEENSTEPQKACHALAQKLFDDRLDVMSAKATENIDLKFNRCLRDFHDHLVAAKEEMELKAQQDWEAADRLANPDHYVDLDFDGLNGIKSEDDIEKPKQ